MRHVYGCGLYTDVYGTVNPSIIIIKTIIIIIIIIMIIIISLYSPKDKDTYLLLLVRVRNLKNSQSIKRYVNSITQLIHI